MPARWMARALAGPIIASMVLAAPPARAQAAPADPDPWLGPDKALHFGASAVIAGGGYAVGVLAFDDYLGPVLLGTGLALGAGAAKETLDAAGLGHPSFRDLTWDVLGTAVGIGISLVVHAALGGPRAAPAR